MYQVKSEPTKFPKTQRKIVALKVPATPSVTMLATQCWKPQKMNSGTPKIIPSGVPFLYIKTARYMIAPQKTDFKRKAIEKSQVATFAIAASTIPGSVMA